MADGKLSMSGVDRKLDGSKTPEVKNTIINNNANKDNGSPNKQGGRDGGSGKKRKLNQQSGGHHQQQSERGGGGGANSSYNGQHAGGHYRLTGGPAWELQPQNASEQQFTGRCRLFVANLPSNVTEESMRKLFSDFGQISEIYIGKGNQFAFIQMDTRNNAENAKNALDGKLFEGRALRVRLAAHAAAIKVTNLPPCVSNELLNLAFSSFGPVERAIVVADDRGRSLNEGIIEFARKSSAQAAIKKCQNECLILSATPLPVLVTPLESRDEDEGVPEKNVLHLNEYRKEREIGPRYADHGTIEHAVANKWKELFKLEAERREAFEAEIRDMHENFRVQMEYFQLEENVKRLRDQLTQMESQAHHMNAGRDARHDYERQRDEQRRQHEAMLRQQEEQIMGPSHGQNDMNVLRRQENELRQQANALQQLLDRQESALRQMAAGGGDSSLGQHQMDSNSMYGHQSNHQAGSIMGGHGPPPPAQQQPQPPNHQMSMTPYGHHHHQYHQVAPPQPPQMNYGMPAMQQPPSAVVGVPGPQNRPPPQPQMSHLHYNGNMGPPQQHPVYGQPPPAPVPPPPVPSTMSPQSQQQHGGNGGGGGGGNNYNKRNRARY